MPSRSRSSVQVFTASPGGFLVDSTLVSGDKEAVLIDAQFTLADAHRLVAQLLESNKTLTTVYITHDHPDHYFGLAVIAQAFPKAKLVALPATVAEIKQTWRGARSTQWAADVRRQPRRGSRSCRPRSPVRRSRSRASRSRSTRGRGTIRTTRTCGSRRSRPSSPATSCFAACTRGPRSRPRERARRGSRRSTSSPRSTRPR